MGTKHLLLSVPREPIFRSCNLFTGRYVKDLGNTPGHLNHWTGAGFQRSTPSTVSCATSGVMTTGRSQVDDQS